MSINHVKFTRFVFLAVRGEARTYAGLSLFRIMYNISILRFGCCNIQPNQGFGKGYHPKPTPISTLIILDMSKTELIIIYNYITCIPTNLYTGTKLTTTA